MEGLRFLPFQTYERRNHERRALIEWARGAGKLINEDPLGSFNRVRKHGEHEVAYSAEVGIWNKLTHSDMHGVMVDFTFANLPPFNVYSHQLREATPLEYIDRMILSDEVLGSATRIKGVYLDGDIPRLWTFQKNVTGRHSTDLEIREEMARLGFTHIPGFHAGKEGSASFVNFEVDVAVFDAHGGNFRTDRNGRVHVIDAVIQELGVLELRYFFSMAK